MTSIKQGLQRATQTVKQAVSDVKQTVKKNESLIKGATAVVTQTSKAVSFGKDAFTQISNAAKKLHGGHPRQDGPGLHHQPHHAEVRRLPEGAGSDQGRGGRRRCLHGRQVRGHGVQRHPQRGAHRQP